MISYKKHKAEFKMQRCRNVVEQLAKLVNSFEQKKDSRVRSLSELQKLDLIRQGEIYFC